MKAAVLYGPEDIRFEEIQNPTMPQVDEVILKIEKAAICGTDLHAFRGNVPAKVPLVAGHEYVGKIFQAGKNVRAFKPGDSVVGSYASSCGKCSFCQTGKPQLCEDRILFGLNYNGAFSKYMRVPRAERTLARIPEGMNHTDALLSADMFLTPLYSVDRAGVSPLTSVLITGLGAVGLSAVLAARVRGARNIIGVEMRDRCIKLASELGASEVIDSGKEGDMVGRVRKLTNGLGVDVALDTSGVPDIISRAIEAVRPGGKFVQVGVPKDKVMLDLRWVESLEKQIIGVLNPGSSTHLQKAMDVVSSNNIPLKKLVTHEFPLEQIQEAYRVADTYEGDPIKIIIQIG
jgi:alcohol dehydrogenase